MVAALGVPLLAYGIYEASDPSHLWNGDQAIVAALALLLTQDLSQLNPFARTGQRQKPRRSFGDYNNRMKAVLLLAGTVSFSIVIWTLFGLTAYRISKQPVRPVQGSVWVHFVAPGAALFGVVCSVGLIVLALTKVRRYPKLWPILRQQGQVAVVELIVLNIVLVRLPHWVPEGLANLSLVVIAVAVVISSIMLSRETLMALNGDSEIRKIDSEICPTPLGNSRPVHHRNHAAISWSKIAEKGSVILIGTILVVGGEMATTAMAFDHIVTTTLKNLSINKINNQAISLPSPPSSVPPSDIGSNGYDAICGILENEQPANNAPKWARANLDALWLGKHGLGATLAGCPGPTEVIHRDGRTVAYEAGYENNELASIAIMEKGKRAALLIRDGGAVTEVVQLLDQGTPVVTSSRFNVGNGDAILLSRVQVHGTTMLVRPVKHPTGQPGISEPYLYLTVSEFAAWFELTRTFKTWLWPRALAISAASEGIGLSTTVYGSLVASIVPQPHTAGVTVSTFDAIGTRQISTRPVTVQYKTLVRFLPGD